MKVDLSCWFKYPPCLPLYWVKANHFRVGGLPQKNDEARGLKTNRRLGVPSMPQPPAAVASSEPAPPPAPGRASACSPLPRTARGRPMARHFGSWYTYCFFLVGKGKPKANPSLGSKSLNFWKREPTERGVLSFPGSLPKKRTHPTAFGPGYGGNLGGEGPCILPLGKHLHLESNKTRLVMGRDSVFAMSMSSSNGRNLVSTTSCRIWALSSVGNI